jgi:hypothetical protein
LLEHKTSDAANGKDNDDLIPRNVEAIQKNVDLSLMVNSSRMARRDLLRVAFSPLFDAAPCPYDYQQEQQQTPEREKHDVVPPCILYRMPINTKLW